MLKSSFGNIVKWGVKSQGAKCSKISSFVRLNRAMSSVASNAARVVKPSDDQTIILSQVHPQAVKKSPVKTPIIQAVNPSTNQVTDQPNNQTKKSNNQMKDEYGLIDTSTLKVWRAPELRLESGELLTNVPIAYQTYGTLSESKDNCLIVCHALTGHAELSDWWPMVGPGRAFDTDKYFIVCMNMLGSCYGTAGPLTQRQPHDVLKNTTHPSNQSTNQLSQSSEQLSNYGPDFPIVTIRDSVNLHRQLIDHLQISSICCVIGGSLGGMQALEWALIEQSINQSSHQSRVQSIVSIACNAQHSAWQIAINHVQRQAVLNDINFHDGHYQAFNTFPTHGLSLARQFAMISYRTHPVYETKFGRTKIERAPSKQSNNPLNNPSLLGTHLNNDIDQTNQTVAKSTRSSSPTIPCHFPYYDIESYLEYQGAKICGRFDPNSYIRLTQLIDSHDVSRGRGDGTVQAALSSIKQPIFIMGVDSDVLYPVDEQKAMAAMIGENAIYQSIKSLEGHDGFLLEQDQIEPAIKQFLHKHAQPKSSTTNKQTNKQSFKQTIKQAIASKL